MGKPFDLKNGTILISTEAPGGVYNATQLKKIAALAESETAIIKATEDQRLALSVLPAKAGFVAKELKAVGLGVRHYQDGLHQPISCLGEACPDHLQDAQGAALDISQVLSGLVLETPLKIGINGCARCCVPCHTLDISIIGEASGYRMSLGGKNSQLPELATYAAEGIPSEKLPELVKSIVDLYKHNTEAGESLQEVIERVGAGAFLAALSPYSQDAAGADNSDPFAGSDEGNEQLDAEAGEAGETEEAVTETPAQPEEFDEIEEIDAVEMSTDFQAPTESPESLELNDSTDADSIDIAPHDFVESGDTTLAADVPIHQEEGNLETSVSLDQSELIPEDFSETIEADLPLSEMEPEEIADIPEMAPSKAESEDLDETPLDSTSLESDIKIDDSLDALDSVESLDTGESMMPEEIEADFLDIENIVEAKAPQAAAPEIKAPGPIATNQAVPPDAQASGQEDEVIDEAALEERLHSSIADEQNLVESDDSNAEEREAATNLLNHNNNDSDTVDDFNEELSEIYTEEELTPESIGPVAVSPSADSTSLHLVDRVESTKTIESNSAADWDVSNVRHRPDGKIVLSFAGGGELALDPNRLPRGSFKTIQMGEVAVRASSEAGGIRLEVDGVEMLIPNKRTAA